PGDGDAERRQAEQNDEQRQLEKDHAGKGEGGKEQRRPATAVRDKQSDSRRHHQTCRSDGKPAEDVLQDREMAEAEVEAIVHGIRMKPATAATAPSGPPSLDPTQVVMPTIFGPGIIWHRVKISANSRSSTHRCSSTTMRRAQTSPPPKPRWETLRTPKNSALGVACCAKPLAPTVSVMAASPSLLTRNSSQRGRICLAHWRASGSPRPRAQ